MPRLAPRHEPRRRLIGTRASPIIEHAEAKEERCVEQKVRAAPVCDQDEQREVWRARHAKLMALERRNADAFKSLLVQEAYADEAEHRLTKREAELRRREEELEAREKANSEEAAETLRVYRLIALRVNEESKHAVLSRQYKQQCEEAEEKNASLKRQLDEAEAKHAVTKRLMQRLEKATVEQTKQLKDVTASLVLMQGAAKLM